MLRGLGRGDLDVLERLGVVLDADLDLLALLAEELGVNLD